MTIAAVSLLVDALAPEVSYLRGVCDYGVFQDYLSHKGLYHPQMDSPWNRHIIGAIPKGHRDEDSSITKGVDRDSCVRCRGLCGQPARVAGSASDAHRTGAVDAKA